MEKPQFIPFDNFPHQSQQPTKSSYTRRQEEMCYGRHAQARTHWSPHAASTSFCALVK